VELTQHGNREAFGELIHRHRDWCIGLAIVLLGNRGDAEDGVQNALSKAYAHLDEYRGEVEFSTWLRHIVANECLTLMRLRRRMRLVDLDAAPAEHARPMELPGCTPDPEGQLAFSQMSKVLKAEIRHMPPLLRNVLILRDIQELPVAAVASRLGITVAAAKSRLLRARRELRVRLSRHMEKRGNRFPLSRSAAPFNRVACHRAIHPPPATNA